MKFKDLINKIEEESEKLYKIKNYHENSIDIFVNNYSKIGKNLNLDIECVVDFGGEGQGDYWYRIFKIEDIFIKIDGSYQSYHGYDYREWRDVKEVFPKEKTIIVYE